MQVIFRAGMWLRCLARLLPADAGGGDPMAPWGNSPAAISEYYICCLRPGLLDGWCGSLQSDWLAHGYREPRPLGPVLACLAVITVPSTPGAVVRSRDSDTCQCLGGP